MSNLMAEARRKLEAGETSAPASAAMDQVIDVDHNGSMVFVMVTQGDLCDILEFTPEAAERTARRLWQAALEIRRPG